MNIEKKYEIKIRDSVFDPNTNLKKVFATGLGTQKQLFKVWIYLEGKDLIYVKNVTYHLHSTFRKPQQKITRTISNQNCELKIWTWGIFMLRGLVEFKNGITKNIYHQLEFGEQLKQEGIEFIKNV